MGRNLDPKCKQCRREGEKLFLKGERCFAAKCSMVKRNYAPGHQGAKGRIRQTEYCKQLREKQKAKRSYMLLEKQFRNYFIASITKKGNTEENLWRMLEMRLDNVIYRIGLGGSRGKARQMVNHNFFEVNGKKVDVPSYQLAVGDVISIKETKQKSKIFENLTEELKKKEIPSWLSFDKEKKEVRVTSAPGVEDLQQSVDMKLIVEYYSR